MYTCRKIFRKCPLHLLAVKHAVANVFREFGSYKYKYVSCSYNRKCDVINKVSDKKKTYFFLILC